MRIVSLIAVFAVWFAGRQSVTASELALAWAPNVSAGVTGYHVHYGTTSGQYVNTVDAGNATGMTISNLSSGVTYYFAVTAYDTYGDESDFSNETSFVLAGTLTLAQGTAPGSPQVIQFPVEPGHWYEVQASANLQDWTSIAQTGIAVSNVWQSYTDLQASTFATRFYRLILH